MDTEGVDERREDDHETEEERGEQGRGNHGSEERREHDRDQQRDEHEGDHEGEEGGDSERGEDREHQETVGEEDARENNGYCHPYTTKRRPRPRHRDIRHVNYAFGEPHVDVAEREAQDWLDHLSLAEEEENDPNKIRHKGPKYRTGTTNESSQMQERLQRCEQDQERHEYRKTIPRTEKRNGSKDIYPVLHVDENEKKPEKAVPLKLWGNTRRSAVGNNSASVYAVMHPSSENGNERHTLTPTCFSCREGNIKSLYGCRPCPATGLITEKLSVLLPQRLSKTTFHLRNKKDLAGDDLEAHDLKRKLFERTGNLLILTAKVEEKIMQSLVHQPRSFCGQVSNEFSDV